MFLDFYKMKAQPFGVTPDPRFLYLGKSHREALASLYYGIESDRGFVALIAQPGLGKTTLTFQLLEKLQQASRTVFLFQTKCNSKEFFHYLLNGLGVDAEGMELVSMHNRLNEILCREMLAGRRFVLAIDEAQNLDPEVLEAIRLLSNFETSRDKMLQILLIGQPQLAKKLASPELEQLQQRISMFARLEPFGYEDTARYIAHRLQVAGYEGSSLFSPGALRLIAEHSQGIPRKINGLCFSALSLGCAMDRKQVDVGMMEEVIADRDVESLQRPIVARRVVPSPVASHPVLPSPVASHPVLPSPMASQPALSSSIARRHMLSSYPERPKRSLGRWAMGTAGVVACVAIGIGILSFSPSRIDRSIQESSEAWAAIRKAAVSIRGFMAVKSDPVPLSSTLNVQAAGLPNSDADQSSLLSDEVGIKTVIVQSGDTLRQIILRTIGEYNPNAIEQVRKLNPDIVNVDHLEVGQAIRLPRVPGSVDSAAASEAASTAGKN
jgi:type II secretory pathway predicted ATPase ExeA